MTADFYYPPKALIADYVRAVIGLTVFGVPALFLSLSSAMFSLLGGLGLLFAAFGLRTAARQITRYRVDDEGIRSFGPFGRTIGWERLERVRLRFFSTWRDRTSGWMQLIVKGGGTAIRIDSTLEGFDRLIEIVFREALARGVVLDDATRQNGRAMGLSFPPQQGAGSR